MAILAKMMFPGDSILSFSDPTGARTHRKPFHECRHRIAMDLYETIYSNMVNNIVDDDDMRESLEWERVGAKTTEYFSQRVNEDGY